MKRRTLFLIFAYISQSVCAIEEYGPSSMVDGVNVMTGDAIISNVDHIVQAYEPIPLIRSYISGDASGENKRWEMFPHLELEMYRRRDKGKRLHSIVAYESSGQALLYTDQRRSEGQKTVSLKIEKNGVGIKNNARGMISGKTNIRNNIIKYKGKCKDKQITLELYTGDGTLRIYQTYDRCKNSVYKRIALLQKERKPNGNWIIYSYDDKQKLKEVKTTNPDQTKAYAKITLTKQHIYTSDKRTLHYSYIDKGSKDLRGFLSHFCTNGREPLEYKIEKFEKQRPKITKIYQGEKQVKNIEYYQPGSNKLQMREAKLNRKSSECQRVKISSSPSFKADQLQHDHTYFYELSPFKDQFQGYQSNCLTTVEDIYGKRTIYFFSKDLQITEIRKLDHKKNRNYYPHRELFIWGDKDKEKEGYLYEYHLEGPRKAKILSKTYTYDDRGNITSLTIQGKITGKQQLDEYQYHAKYTDDNFNLPLEEWESNGNFTRYTYLENTNLITSILKGKGNKIHYREFYTYNLDNILVKKIIDNGTTPNKNNLKGITQRNITHISPRKNHPALGLPEYVKETYVDLSTNQEILLKKTQYHYTNRSEIAGQTIYDTSGNKVYTLKNTYDKAGRLISETDPLGRETKYSYNSRGNLIQKEDCSKRYTTCFYYDNADNLIQTTVKTIDGQLRHTKQIYNNKHQVKKEIDHFGNQINYKFDDYDRLITTIYPEILSSDKRRIQPTEEKQYNILGHTIKEINPNKSVTSITYNIHGEPLLIQKPGENPHHYTYNLDGTLAHKVDNLGTKTTYSYDYQNRPLVIKVYSKQGELLSEERYTYDAFNVLTHQDSEGNTTIYTYDGAGRKIKEQICDSITNYTYDSLGRIATQTQGQTIVAYEYDLLDQILQETTHDLDGNLLRKTNYSYDTAGNKIQTLQTIGEHISITKTNYDGFNRPILTTDPLGHQIHIEYCSYKNSLNQTCEKIITTDPNGVQAIQYFDALGQVSVQEKRTALTLLAKEVYFYDANGNRIEQQNHIIAPNEETEILITTWTYTPNNNLVSLTEAKGTQHQRTTYYTYTQNLVKTITKPNGIEIHHSYDALARLKTISAPGISYTYAYDRLHRVVQIEDEINGTISRRSYDHLNNITSETLANGHVLNSTYDNEGRRIQLTLPDQSTIHYNHGFLDLKSITKKDLKGNHQYTYHYDDYDLSGNLLSARMIGDLGTISYARDPCGRLSKLTTPFLSEIVEQRDPVGKILTLTTQNQTHNYGYDDLYQLEEEQTPTTTNTFTHDSIHRPRGKNGKAYHLNQLNQILHDGDNYYKYDLNGNRVQKNNTRYVYDSFDRLIRIEEEEKVIKYTYDPWNRCMGKTLTYRDRQWTEPIVHEFIYDSQREIGIVEHKEITHLRILGKGYGAEIGAAIAIEIESEIYAPVHDHRGNIRALVALSTKQVIESYEYSAFGEETIFDEDGKESSFSLINNPWRFSSKRAEGDLVYFGERFYDPNLGCWINPDPAGFTDGVNLYVFVMNNPIIFLDYFGLNSVHPELRASDSKYFWNAVVFHAFSEKMHKGYSTATQTPYLAEQGGRYIHYANNSSTIYPMCHINGINTTRKDIKERAEKFSMAVNSGVVCSLIGNKGFINNVLSAHRQGKGHFEDEILQVVEDIRYVLERTRDQSYYCYINLFSKGAIVFNRAADHLTENERRRLVVYACGPAEFVENRDFAYVKNYVAEKDPVPMLDKKHKYRDVKSGAHNEMYINNLEKQINVEFFSTDWKYPLSDHSFDRTYWDKVVRSIYDFDQDFYGKEKFDRIRKY